MTVGPPRPYPNYKEPWARIGHPYNDSLKAARIVVRSVDPEDGLVRLRRAPSERSATAVSNVLHSNLA